MVDGLTFGIFRASVISCKSIFYFYKNFYKNSGYQSVLHRRHAYDFA